MTNFCLQLIICLMIQLKVKTLKYTVHLKTLIVNQLKLTPLNASFKLFIDFFKIDTYRLPPNFFNESIKIEPLSSAFKFLILTALNYNLKTFEWMQVSKSSSVSASTTWPTLGTRRCRRHTTVTTRRHCRRCRRCAQTYPFWRQTSQQNLQAKNW